MKVFANDGGNGTKNDWVVGDSEGNTFWVSNVEVSGAYIMCFYTV